MDARFYNSEEIDIQQLTHDLENRYRMKGYEAQSFGDKNQTTVQLKKGSELAALIGLQTALSVIIQRMAGGTVAMIGQQKWADKAAVGAVGLVAAPVLWPLMLTAGAGAIKQASLGNEVLNDVDWLVRQQYPELRPGAIPASLMPQVQQQWTPPPPQYVPVYTPPAPTSRPPTPVYVPSAQASTPTPTKLRCPSCNTPYEEGDTFCSGCGRSLKTLCPNCKTEIKPGVAFCPKCGASIFQATKNVQARPTQAPSPMPPTTPPTPVYTPPASQPQQTPAPAPEPYVPPVPKEPPVMPRPSVTLIPGSTTPPAPTPPPRQPQVPVYKPSQHAAPPPHPTPISTSAQQPTARQPIKARPTSQPVTDSNDPWGKLVFSNGRELELSGERVLVGRVDHDVPGINPDIDLQDLPGGDTTSRIHALIEHIGSAYMLTDLNSTNATRLNNKRLEPDKATAINDGDTLQFGKVTCTFKRV